MNTPSRAARLFKIGVGLFLMISGLAVTALLFLPYRKAIETRTWTETPCEILVSFRKEEQVSEFSQPVQRVFIKYRYTFAGTEHTGYRWRRVTFFEKQDRDVAKKTPHIAEADKLVAKYPAGAKLTCWVNPGAPGEAVLEHHTRAAIYTLWWPMLFAVGGGGMVWSVLRRRVTSPDAPDHAP